MTPEIKQRIEQIRRGEVPEGYKKGKLGIVPEEWNETSFSTLFTSTSEYTDDLDKYPLYSLTIEDGVTPKTERYERSHLVKKEDSYKIVRPNDYAYNPMNLRFGSVARHKGNLPVAVSGYYDIFTTVHKSDLPFMDSFLTCDPMITYYNRVSTGSLVEKQRVHFSQFLEFVLPLPSINERAKIAAILTTQDKVIELKEKRLAEKQRQKKYLMQQLLTGKKRLPGFSKEWKSVRLRNTLNVCHGQNHRNVEQENGVYPILGTGGEIGRTNDFLYDKPSILIGRKGSINKPMYMETPFWTIDTLFYCKIKSGYHPKFLFFKFQSINWNKYDESSGVPSLNASTIGSVDIFAPEFPEQTAIAEVLSAADREIDLLRQDIEQEKQKKKALMQLLLTGIVRVKT